MSFILYIMGSMSLLEWVQGSLRVLPKDEEMLEMDGVRPNLSSLTFSYYCPTSPHLQKCKLQLAFVFLGPI